MAYVPLTSIQNPAAGLTLLSAWGDQVFANEEFFYQRKAASCRASVVQNVPSGLPTVVDFTGGVDYDPSTMIGSSYLTIPVAGIWTVTTALIWGVDVNGARESGYLLNGSAGIMTVTLLGPTGGGDCAYSHTEPDRALSVSDHVGVQLQQSSGSTLNASVFISARWIST